MLLKGVKKAPKEINLSCGASSSFWIRERGVGKSLALITDSVIGMCLTYKLSRELS